MDSGNGIPSVELQKVLERFYRVEDPMTRTTGGSGLGLDVFGKIRATDGAAAQFRGLNG